MKELLYWIVEWIAKIHSHILRLNDAYEYNFTDKELHFLVIGMMGMGFIFVVFRSCLLSHFASSRSFFSSSSVKSYSLPQK